MVTMHDDYIYKPKSCIGEINWMLLYYVGKLTNQMVKAFGLEPDKHPAVAWYEVTDPKHAEFYQKRRLDN